MIKYWITGHGGKDQSENKGQSSSYGKITLGRGWGFVSLFWSKDKLKRPQCTVL